MHLHHALVASRPHRIVHLNTKPILSGARASPKEGILTCLTLIVTKNVRRQIFSFLKLPYFKKAHSLISIREPKPSFWNINFQKKKVARRTTQTYRRMISSRQSNDRTMGPKKFVSAGQAAAQMKGKWGATVATSRQKAKEQLQNLAKTTTGRNDSAAPTLSYSRRGSLVKLQKLPDLSTRKRPRPTEQQAVSQQQHSQQQQEVRNDAKRIHSAAQTPTTISTSKEYQARKRPRPTEQQAVSQKQQSQQQREVRNNAKRIHSTAPKPTTVSTSNEYQAFLKAEIEAAVAVQFGSGPTNHNCDQLSNGVVRSTNSSIFLSPHSPPLERAVWKRQQQGQYQKQVSATTIELPTQQRIRDEIQDVVESQFGSSTVTLQQQQQQQLQHTKLDFLKILRLLLDNAKAKKHDHIIHWVNDTSFLIHDEEALVPLLSSYFNSTINLETFQVKLRIWGFQSTKSAISNTKTIIFYSHPLFQRDRCSQLQKSARRKKGKSWRPDTIEECDDDTNDDDIIVI